MDQTKYKECEELGFHDFGYFEQSGVCLHCGMLHDCAAEWDFEYDNGYKCNVCHSYVDEVLSEEIEEENAESRLLEQDFKKAMGF